MFCKSAKGFTLLEVMLAVAVMALAGIAIYRFVDVTVAAVQAGRREDEERGETAALIGYLRSQLAGLPEGREEAVSGWPHRFEGVPCDELNWIASAGSGVLTRYAAGEWQVTLTARQISGELYEIGLRRRAVNHSREGEWLPLLGGVRGFEVRYFDPWRKEWMEKWVSPSVRPLLVRVKLWRGPEAEPCEVVLRVPPMAQPAANNSGSGGAALRTIGGS